MKKLIFLFLVLYTSIYSQSWNNYVTTTIPYSYHYLGGVDQFANRNGIHILVNSGYPTNNLKYYRINTSGTILGTPYTVLNQEVPFSCIDGDNNNIYVVYQLGTQINVLRSTNNGSSWINNILPININSGGCNYIDIFFSTLDHSLHIVWATPHPEIGYAYQTFYKKYDGSAWSTTENVTNFNEYETGGFPTVTRSSSKVHVSYNVCNAPDPWANYGYAKTRDKLGTQWQDPQEVLQDNSMIERVHTGASKLFDFYYKFIDGGGNYHSDLYVKDRSFTGTWSGTGTLLETYASVYYIVSATTTADGHSHIVFPGENSVVHREYNGTDWTTISPYTVGSNYYSPTISSYSNDLYVTWASTSNVIYRQYDVAPIAPQNVQVVQNANNHPYLTWNANTEPDKFNYIIEKCDACDMQWYQLTQTNNTYYEDQSEVYCTHKPCIMSCAVIYRIKAVDINNHISDPSNEATAYVTGHFPHKEIGQNPELNIPAEYVLDQNFPNPFNPTTTISYGLKEAGFVTLKVYDMLGREVAELVNENQNEGYHTTEFNAVELPSGIYFYQINSGSFNDIKKMLLIK